MQINVVDFVAGAKQARGVTVVIDVFRAFTTACYCFNAGAETVIAVDDSDRALAMADTLSRPVLLGERYGKRLPGFDFGNSPSEIAGERLQGKTVVHTTHAGTQGLVNARNAETVYTGAFVNARATAAVIQSLSPKIVTLVRMGLNANEASDEDWLYADYLTELLRGREVDDGIVYRKLRASPYSARFFDPAQPWSPSADFDYCLNFNHFNFALQAQAISANASELSVIKAS
jgi:Phosphosulfolactate phosphohydrolase and related enzymes